MIKFFNPGQEFKNNKEEYLKEWLRVREAGNLILREDVEKFETELAKYVGTKYAVGLNSGTDALFIALKALGIKEGDKVLVPSHTFVATAQVVAQVGAIPELYDLEDSVENILIDFGNNIAAVVVAHIAGAFSNDNMESLIGLAKSYQIPVIEDACQALGATQKEKKAGSFGDAGAFSFYPAKILGGPGDGGALVTDNLSIYKFAIEYRNHWKTDYSRWGINSRLDNVLAAELVLKLARIEKNLARREEIANKYIAGLNQIDGLGMPSITKGRVWQDYVVNAGDKRDALFDFLAANEIETMKNDYHFPMIKMPKSLKYEAETLRLPINEVLTDSEVEQVILKVKEFYAR